MPSTPTPGRTPQRLAPRALLLALLVAACAALLPALLRPAPLRAQSAITSPAPGSAIAGDVPILGTALIDPFQKYELHYKIEPSGDDGFVYFDGSTTPVTNGQLGIWRAAGLPPGTYTLRLRVVKADGNYAEFLSPNLSVNQGPAPTPTPATPTATPTALTPTPTFTPGPTATPNVGAVQQPQLDPAATPSPIPGDPAAAPADPAAAPADPAAAPAAAPAGTPVALLPGDLAAGQSSAAAADPAADPAIVDPAAASTTRALGEALSLDRLRAQLYRGMRFSAALFLLAVALYGAKRIFDWARRTYG